MADSSVRDRKHNSARANTIEFTIDGMARYSGDITLGGFLYQLKTCMKPSN